MSRELTRRIKGRPDKYLDIDKAFVIHPDILEAFLNYDGTGSSFEAIFNIRGKIDESGFIYHNHDWDEEMFRMARERTQEWAARGGRMPERRRKNE